MSSSGFVYLVGAGPGDPRLLTLRAYELLRTAEIVAHDELVPGAILALAPPAAERIRVGRRHGHGPTAYRLHPAVLERARAGRTVVRLKCGDPLVFGRGGEEAEELVEAGIGFEIVPGVTAAIGAAAYAAIPLTHRRHASSVTFATGHHADERSARGETVVLFMAARRLARNLARLAARGLAPTTPAAYVSWATTPGQEVVVGTLSDLHQRARDAEPSAPALVIVGEVVALRRQLAWLERQPLRGRRILVARARATRSEIAARLRVLGAEVLERPAPAGPASLVAADPLPPIDLVVLPSSSAARAVLSNRLGQALRGLPMVAMGPRTEAEARRLGALRVHCAAADTASALVSHVATALTAGGVS